MTTIALCLNLSMLAAPPERPNIVFILADDLGYGDLGCYGCPDIRTPNLDRLAGEGVRLTDFYANATVCTPTRCAFMTGRYQQRIGALEWAIRANNHRIGLPPQEKTIASLLHDAGYATAMSGKWHLGHRPDFGPNRHGFDEFFGLHGGNHDYFTHRDVLGNDDLFRNTEPVRIEGYSTDLIRRHALEFLDAMKDRPFFLYVAFNAPHWPFQGPEDGHIQLTERTWHEGTRRTYVQMVERMDEAVGRILAALDRHGLRERTLVVFTSDNGGDQKSRNAPLRDFKTTLWEGGIRVPCIVRWPGRVPAGKTSPQVGITMDFSASILRLAGAKPPADRPLDGVDLLPILAGTEPVRQRTLFWRRVDVRGVKTHRAARDGDLKYIDEPSGNQHLFDLARDIGEEHDLSASMPERAAAMKKLLDDWEADVDPPLYDQPANQMDE